MLLNLDFDSHCQWGSWGAWTECSSPCNGGFRKSVRKIKMNATGNGLPCADDYVRRDVCNREKCPGNYVNMMESWNSIV